MKKKSLRIGAIVLITLMMVTTPALASYSDTANVKVILESEYDPIIFDVEVGTSTVVRVSQTNVMSSNAIPINNKSTRDLMVQSASVNLHPDWELRDFIGYQERYEGSNKEVGVAIDGIDMSKENEINKIIKAGKFGDLLFDLNLPEDLWKEEGLEIMNVEIIIELQV